jgi:hypothetical protein
LPWRLVGAQIAPFETLQSATPQKKSLACPRRHGDCNHHALAAARLPCHNPVGQQAPATPVRGPGWRAPQRGHGGCDRATIQ